MFKKNKSAPAERQRPAVNSRTQNSVFSYYAANKVGQNVSQPGSKRNAKDNEALAIKTRQAEPGALKRKIAWGMLVVVVLAALLNSWLASAAQIDIVQSRGSELMHPQQTYAQAAQSFLAESIGNHTKLTLNGPKIAQKMASTFPEIDSVQVKTPLIGQKPIIVLSPSVPALQLITKDGRSYVLDANGRAIMQVIQTTASIRALPVVQDQTVLSIKLGAIALPGPSVDFITEVVNQLKAKKLAASNLVLPAGSNSLEAKVGNEPYIVKFNLMGSARVESGAYLAVKQQLDSENKKPSSYVDVRVESRVYYK